MLFSNIIILSMTLFSIVIKIEVIFLSISSLVPTFSSRLIEIFFNSFNASKIRYYELHWTNFDSSKYQCFSTCTLPICSTLCDFKHALYLFPV